MGVYDMLTYKIFVSISALSMQLMYWIFTFTGKRSVSLKKCQQASPRIRQ